MHLFPTCISISNWNFQCHYLTVILPKSYKVWIWDRKQSETDFQMKKTKIIWRISWKKQKNFRLPLGLINSVKLIISSRNVWPNSDLIAIILISGCWASAHAFFTTSKLSIKHMTAFGRLLINCRDISSLVYHGLTVVITKLASDAPSHAMTYSEYKKTLENKSFSI